MDFFDSQEQAKRKTSRLVVFFALSVAAMIVAIYLVAVLAFGTQTRAANFHWWKPELFLGVATITSGIIFLGSLYKTLVLRSGGGEAVANMLGGRRIPPHTDDRDERRLLNVVEEMALAAGLPVPPVFVLDQEPGINAFAAGFSPDDAVIGVNRGTIDHLSRDELQGVIAHEFSHILHGDMRLNLRLIGLLHGILLLSTIGYYLMRTGGFSGGGRKNSGVQLALIGLAVFVIGYVGLFFARLIKAGVSRQREYLADAAAVQFTRNPEGLSGALQKIGGLAQRSYVRSPEAENASHLFFGNYRRPSLPSFSTHPPLSDRIHRIDPQFDGKFPSLSDKPKAAPEASRKRKPASPFEALEKTLPGMGGRFPLDPVTVLAMVGSPTSEHAGQAQRILAQMPDSVRDAVHDVFMARCAVLAVLLDENPEIRERQIEIIRSKLGDVAVRETTRLVPELASLGVNARLPLLELVHSTLRQLSPDQYRDFRETAQAMIRADQTVDVFEFVVLRTLLDRLDKQFHGEKPRQVRYPSIRGVANEVGDLLSALAYVGHGNEAEAQAAFDVAAKAYDGDIPLTIKPRHESSLKTLNEALDKLAHGSSAVKSRVIRAASVAVAADGTVTASEAELLRAIADALNCPVPPLYAGSLTS